MIALADFDAPLAGDGVALRLAAERDIPEVLIAHQDDRHLHRRLRLDRPPSGAELGRRAEDSPRARDVGESLWLTVLSDLGDDECRGQLDVFGVDAEHGRAELTIWIAPADRGRGLGSAALALAGRWLLADGGLQRVGLLVEPDDAPMLAAATAAGYAREGRLRGYLLDRRGRIDVESLSLVRTDVRPATASLD